MSRKNRLIRNIRNKKKEEIPIFNVPFPPKISVEEIMDNRADQKLGSRPPNNYIIYRLAYIKELKKRTDVNISMTRLSPFISRSWKKESREVKEKYKEISNEVGNQLEQDRKKNLIYVYEKFPDPSPPVVHGEIMDSEQVPDTETLLVPSPCSPSLLSPYNIVPHPEEYPEVYAYVPVNHQTDQDLDFSWPLQDYENPFSFLYNFQQLS